MEGVGRPNAWELEVGLPAGLFPKYVLGRHNVPLFLGEIQAGGHLSFQACAIFLLPRGADSGINRGDAH